jgi:L-cysteine S-thiosulfotransferase
MKKSVFALTGLAGAALVSAAIGVQAQTMDPQMKAILDSSFESKGIAKKDRIYPDEIQALCSEKVVYESPEGQQRAIELQEIALKSIKPPSDGVYLGDWKAGEKVAQSGRGLTWRDNADKPNGGSCYNCHQVTKQEISYGTIGPSLLGYGKLRGNSQEIIEYTWNRINNSKAYNLCSNMPRFAHFNILTEQQIKDVMALLLDPQSPVNQ